LNEEDLQNLFIHWKLTYNVEYYSSESEQDKFKTFKDNYLFVINHNSDPT